MLRFLIAGLLGCVLASCTIPGAVAPLQFGDLQSARAACNARYPARIGNYLPHASCVNEAVETFAIPSARYPDLVRLQEEVRSALSARIDRRTISPRAGERRMAEADRLINQAERDRDRLDETEANRRVAAIQAMMAR
ncbi:MAG: hypothetical protein JO267_01495 [Alphaproteobacteria bacterium]|nr:hypothetical protein [Alphaproteobacteria bacterium]